MKHDHPLEWVWFALTVLDVWVSSSSYLAAWRDEKRSRDAWAKFGPAARIAKADARAVTHAIYLSSAGNATFAFMFLACAVLALFLPPPPPNYLTVKQSLYVIGVLIVATVLNTVLSIYGRLVRFRLSTGWYERRERHKQAGTKAGTAIASAYDDLDAGKGRVGPGDA